MKVITNIQQMHSWSRRICRKGKRIGFVPTMGYLHEGHLSLMRKARKENDYLVISIFVNPRQFSPKEDLKQYPRNFSEDKRLAKLSGVDVIFYPRAQGIYPQGYKTCVKVEQLSDLLCGAFRPGHFPGVTTAVLKLFNIVQPDAAYFGQKDAQQAIIIKRMVKDLNVPVKIKVLPIIREANALAMSSRNTYLNSRQRKDAVILYKALQVAVGMIQSGYKDRRKIVAEMRTMIKSRYGARIEYIKIVNAFDLKEVKKIKGKLLIALAVYFGKTRLIDNLTIHA